MKKQISITTIKKVIEEKKAKMNNAWEAMHSPDWGKTMDKNVQLKCDIDFLEHAIALLENVDTRK